MTGYLRPFLPELKISDYRTYREYCCGLCAQLHKDYGVFTRLLLNHDMVTFALLSDSLAGRQGRTLCVACPRHCIHKRKIISQTQGIRVAARIQVMLTYFTALHGRTPSTLKGRIVQQMRRWVLRNAFEKASGDSRQLLRLLRQERDHANALAEAGCADIEAAAAPAANIMGAIFASCAPDESSVGALRRVGGYVGRIYSYLTQAETFEHDKANGIYNAYVVNGMTRAAAAENAKSRCNMAAAELAKAYNLLGLTLNRSLMDNIVFLGLERTVAITGDERRGKWEYDEAI